MSLSISYSTTYSDWSVSDYLVDWADYFGDSSHSGNTGGFYPGVLSGTQYAMASWNTDAAFIVEGNLAYSLFQAPMHTLYGYLEEISLGTQVIDTNSGFEFGSGGWEVTFSGLDLYSAQSEGHAGIVHQLVYGLMSGNASVLEATLDDLLGEYGVSTDDTFDVVAAALSAGPLSAGLTELVGVPELADDLALAA